MFFYLGHISLSQCACYVVRGGALGICQSEATHVAALWHCMWGRGPRGNSAASLALSQISLTSPASHKQIGPFWCQFPGEWFCVLSGTLWVSPTNSPVRLGVSPTAATPTEYFSQRFEALFPRTGTLVCVVCVTPQLFLLVYAHTNVGLPAPAAAALP